MIASSTAPCFAWDQGCVIWPLGSAPYCRGSIGDHAILGDPRWAGIFGVEADYVADENCKICVFLAADIRVQSSCPCWLENSNANCYCLTMAMAMVRMWSIRLQLITWSAGCLRLYATVVTGIVRRTTALRMCNPAVPLYLTLTKLTSTKHECFLLWNMALI